MFLTFSILSVNAPTSAATANNDDFIENKNNNFPILKNNSNYSNVFDVSNSVVASNFQPDFNIFFEGILKIIYKIVPDQFADGTLSVSSRELEERKAILKKHIKFENDIRLFTLYAFMNYTGYSGSSNNSEFNDVRNMLIQDLNKKNLKLSDNKYYSNKEIQSIYYINALRNIGLAPKFEIIGHKGNIQSSLLDLPECLKEFYLKADIESLYNKYKSFYNAEFKKFEDNCLTSLVVINNYMKINNDDIPDISIEINLLDEYGKNAVFTSVDKYKGNAVITLGPSKDQYIQAIVHEYLHCIINPIVDNMQSEVSKLSYKAKEIPPYSPAKLYYNDWSVIVEESIVKALEYRAYGGNRKASVEKAMEEGFILTQYFDERFNEFKNYKGNLNSFIESLLQEYYMNKK